MLVDAVSNAGRYSYLTLYRVFAAASAVIGAAADAVTVASSDPSTAPDVAVASAAIFAASADIHCFDQSYSVAVAPVFGQIPGQMLLTI